MKTSKILAMLVLVLGLAGGDHGMEVGSPAYGAAVFGEAVDFNGDGKFDLLWHDVSTGYHAATLMDGVTMGSSGWLGGDLDWQLVGTPDFNGDGKTDLLWRQASTGYHAATLMDGTTAGSTGWLGGDLDWRIVATPDFNGDGKSDLLWRQASTGCHTATLMDGLAMASSGWLGGDTDWQIVATLDFNGDGKADLLWRQGSTGYQTATLMDGLTMGSSGWLGGDADWQMVLAPDLSGAGSIQAPLNLTGSIAYPGAVVKASNAKAGIDSGYGVLGEHTPTGNLGGLGGNVYGAWGIQGGSSNFGALGGIDHAGYFDGDVYVSGAVGVGTISPDAMLHISKSSGNLGARVSSDVTSYQGMTFGATNGYSIGRAPDETFFINRDEPLGSGVLRVLTVQSDGDVGIGTTSPDYNLHVEGKCISGENCSASGYRATVSGGYRNEASYEYATVAGGADNTASDNFATVAGGVVNTASYDYATVAGGGHNTASARAATVAGGEDNTASGSWATVAGGEYNNAAGSHSFATGYYADALHEGCFVWSDSSADTKFSSTATNQFLIRATGGVGISTNDPAGYELYVNGTAAKPGGGSWSNPSDIRLKELSSDYARGLAEVSGLNPTRYRYRENNKLGLPADEEFVGLVAQDVQDVIPEAVEENSDGYLMVNNDPIIWAMVNAIKELEGQNRELKAENESLRGQLHSQSQSFEGRLEAVERRMAQYDSAIVKQGGLSERVEE